jgi:hypothetical protein
MMRKAVNILTRDSPRTFSLYLDHCTCLLAHLSDELPAQSNTSGCSKMVTASSGIGKGPDVCGR